MKISSLSAILHALNHAGVKYLVVGGVAVNLLGYQRVTADIDLVIQLTDENIQAALKTLAGLDYRPTVPEPIEAFADARKRLDWVKNRNMVVFQLRSPRFKDTSIDIFVEEPFNFDKEYLRAVEIKLDRELTIRLIDSATLIAMKQDIGRDKDRDDIHHLKLLLEE